MENHPVIRAQRTQVPARARFLYNQSIPASPISSILGLQGTANGIEPIRRHTRDRLRPVGSRPEGQGNGNRHEVHIADIGVELGAVEGEFAEGPIDVYIGVGRVVDGGLDQGGARVEEEG